MNTNISRYQFSVCIVASLTTSCVSMSKLTVDGAASIAKPTEVALQDISDLESWRRGGPAGIQMLEGMHEASPDNMEITSALAKAYNAYATLVAETDMMEDTFLDRKYSPAKDLAVDYHARAIGHAKAVLEHSGLTWSNQPDQLKASLQPLSPSDQNVRDVAFVLGQSMKSLIGLKRGTATFLDLQAAAESVVQWTCDGGTPTYPKWGCKALHAVEMAEKPVIAGGNPAAARKEFDQLIADNPDDLMLVAMRAQFVLTKIRDAKCWQESKALYQKHVAERDATIKRRVTDNVGRDRNALANAAGAERLRQLIRYERDLF